MRRGGQRKLHINVLKSIQIHEPTRAVRAVRAARAVRAVPLGPYH